MALPVAIQLYSLRDELDKDFKGTLKTVKEMGYDGVEFAGLADNDPKEVKAWLDELGLVAVSAHVPLEEFIREGEEEVLKKYLFLTWSKNIVRAEMNLTKPSRL